MFSASVAGGRLRCWAAQRPGPHPGLDEPPPHVADAGRPAFAEYAPGVEALSWLGLLAPARTPQPAVHALNGAGESIVGDVQDVVGGTPAEFAQFLQAQQAASRPVLARMEVPLN